MKRLVAFTFIIFVLFMGGDNMTEPRTKFLTDIAYSPDETATPRQDVDGAIDEVFQNLNVAKEESANITTNRKLSPTGDFSGTWNGATMTAVEPGLSSIVNTLVSTSAKLVNKTNRTESKNEEIILSSDQISKCFTNFDVDNVKSADWTVNSDGTFSVNALDKQYLLIANERLADFKLSIRYVNPVQGSGLRGIQVIFRGTDTKNYYVAGIYAQTSGAQTDAVYIFKYVNGSLSSTLKSQILSGNNLIGTNTVNINVDVKADTVNIILNGVIVLTDTRTEYLECKNNLFGVTLPYSASPGSQSGILLANLGYTKYSYNCFNVRDNDSCLFVGDSIMNGQGVATASRFSNLLATKLNTYAYNVTNKNISINGANSTECLNSLKTELAIKSDYKYCFFEFGTNDTRIDGSKHTTDTQFKNNTTEFIRLLKKNGIIPVMLIPPFFSKDMPDGIIYDNTSYYRLVELDAFMRKISQDEKIIMIDNSNLFNGDYATYFQIDKVHPNVAGHNKIFENICSALSLK